jgi:glutaredoxin 3
MIRVRMYCTAICPYCVAAERFLALKGVRDIEKLRVDLRPDLREAMIDITRRRTVPQIFIGDTHVGGYDDLLILERSGRLDALLQCLGRG